MAVTQTSANSQPPCHTTLAGHPEGGGCLSPVGGPYALPIASHSFETSINLTKRWFADHLCDVSRACD